MQIVTELPDWYVLKKEKIGGEIEVDKLVQYGKERINQLKTLQNSSEIISEKKTILGHIALRITAALTDDKIFVNWFIEKEGDAFQFLFEKESYTGKINILKDLFDGNLIIEPETIISTLNLEISESDLRALVASSLPYWKKMLSTDILIATKFYYLPKAVKERIGYYKKGWVVIPLRLIKGDIKNLFQKKLKSKITLLRDKLKSEKERYNLLVRMAEEILSYWKKIGTRVNFYDEEFYRRERGLYSKINYYPPCMRDLLSKLKATGYLSHGERLQLGLFLKRLGMSLEEQMDFWYKNAVDNIGISREEFEKKAGYIIRHIYGLEGSRKDYEVPKCETIINRYYCYFASNDLSTIRSYLSKNVPEKNIVDDIIEEIKNRGYQIACAKFLTGKYKVKFRRPMSHPLLFFKLAYSSDRKTKTKNHVESESK